MSLCVCVRVSPNTLQALVVEICGTVLRPTPSPLFHLRQQIKQPSSPLRQDHQG